MQGVREACVRDGEGDRRQERLPQNVLQVLPLQASPQVQTTSVFFPFILKCPVYTEHQHQRYDNSVMTVNQIDVAH